MANGIYVLRTTLWARESPFPTVLDFNAFTYDFNFLYEIHRLALDPKYAEFDFRRSSRIHTRYGRPLEESDRLRLESIRLESPLEFITLIPIIGAAVAAVWGAVQVVDKISRWKLERRALHLDNEKKRLEVQKLERELAKLDQEIILPREIEPELSDDASRLVEQAGRLLLPSSFVLDEYKFDVIRPGSERDADEDDNEGF